MKKKLILISTILIFTFFMSRETVSQKKSIKKDPEYHIVSNKLKVADKTRTHSQKKVEKCLGGTLKKSSDLKGILLSLSNKLGNFQESKSLEDIEHIRKLNGDVLVIKKHFDPKGRRKLSLFKLSSDGFPLKQTISDELAYEPTPKFLEKIKEGESILSIKREQRYYSKGQVFIEYENNLVKKLNLFNITCNQKDEFLVCNC